MADQSTTSRPSSRMGVCRQPYLESGYIKHVPLDTYREQGRGGKGIRRSF